MATPLGGLGWGCTEGAVESGVLIKDQRKDQACWGVMIKEGGGVSLRGSWARQFSVHREPARELEGEVSFAKLFSPLFTAKASQRKG